MDRTWIPQKCHAIVPLTIQIGTRIHERSLPYMQQGNPEILLSQSNHLHLGANRVRRAAASCIRKAFSRSFERRSGTGIWGRPRRGRKRFRCVPFETRSIEFLFFGSATSPPVRANTVSERRGETLSKEAECVVATLQSIT